MQPDRSSFFGVGGVLMHADRGRIDHLDIAVVSLWHSFQKPIPDARLAPPVETVHAGRVRTVAFRNVGPRCARPQPPEIPFNTRRSSTRVTPRGLFGSRVEITDHSKSVKSKRAIPTSLIWRLNHSCRFGNPLYEIIT
jgi:hypothetical protein